LAQLLLDTLANQMKTGTFRCPFVLMLHVAI